MAFDIIIRVLGIDDASGPLGNVNGALGNLASFAGKLALGGIVAGVGALGAGLGLAINEAAGAQDALAGLDAVFKATSAGAAAAQAEYDAAVKQTVTGTRMSADELSKLQSKLTDTQLSYNTLSASIQEQKQKIIQNTAAYGENGLVVLKQKAQLAEMENNLGQLGATMDTLKGKLVSGGQVIQTNLAEKLGLVPPVARMTRDELIGLSSELQNTTKFSDETVMGAEKIMLTFTQVGRQVFPDAIKSAADLSTVFGIDLQSATTMLGKALQDPIAGITALRRVGVSFSDAQEKQIKDLIKHNDLLGAQKIILGELKTETGGAAEAMGKTMSGQLEIMRNKFSDLLENVGMKFLPGITTALSGVIDFLSSPEVGAALDSFANLLAGGMTQGVSFIQTTVLPALQQLGNWFMTVGLPALQGFAAQAGPVLQGAFAQGIGFIQTTVLPALQQFGGFLLTTVVPALVQFGGFLQANVLPYLIQFGTWLGGTILTSAQQLGGWLMGSLVPALVTMGQTIATAALPILTQLGGWLQGTLIPALQQFATFAGPYLQAAFSWLGNFLVGTVIPVMTQLGVWILTKGIPVLGDFAAIIGGVLNGALAQLGPLWAGITSNFQKAVTFVSDTTKNFAAMADTIQKTLAPVVEWFNTTILEPLRQTFDGLVNLAKGFFEWLQKIADMLANLQIPDFLQRHSPSPLEQALMNSNAYLRDMAMLAPAAFRSFGGNVGMPAYALPLPATNFQTANASATNGGARQTHFHGPVTIVAHDYNDFKRQLNDDVNIEQRFMSYAGG